MHSAGVPLKEVVEALTRSDIVEENVSATIYIDVSWALKIEDAVVFEMKTKGQETMWILHCQLNHAQANQSPMISCWNPP